MANRHEAYKRTQILTARPEQLTLMLLDGAVRFVEKASDCIRRERFDGSYQALSRAQQIVMELLNSLRPENAPQLCRRQAGLYLFIYQKLVEANAHRDTEPAEQALGLLKEVRETWIMLMEKLRAEAVRQDPANRPAPSSRPAISIKI